MQCCVNQLFFNLVLFMSLRSLVLRTHLSSLNTEAVKNNNNSLIPKILPIKGKMYSTKILFPLNILLMATTVCGSIQKLFPSELMEIHTVATVVNEPVKDLIFAFLKFRFIEISKEKISFLLFKNGKSFTVDEKNCTQFINVTEPTKVIIPAWLNSPSTEWVQTMVAKYQKKSNYNLIVVDWSSIANKNYIYAASASKAIGSRVGDLIVTIFPNSLADLHVIGFSLAGHIAGFAGKRVTQLSGKKIGRLTALDPAGVLFEVPLPRPAKDRLANTDAEFVDLIHTETFLRGSTFAYGHVDFYVNPGQLVQNGCQEKLPDINSASSCSHQKVHFLFIRTILDDAFYEAVACSNIAMFKAGKCNDNERALMGDSVRKDAKGKYYIAVDGSGNPKGPNDST